MTMQMTPPVKDEERKHAPTILAALEKSTREERANPDDREKGDDLAKDLYRIMEEWAEKHEGFYAEADENWRFYKGQHYAYWSTALNTRVLQPEVSSGTVRLTLNYIRRAVERGVSILLKDRPIIKCIAGDSEILDVAASEAADDVVEWRQRRTTLAADPERVARGSMVSGAAWVHEEYDQTLGKLVPTGQMIPTGEMEVSIGPDGVPVEAPKMEPEMLPEGDYCREILSHRQVVPDPTATHPFAGSGFFIRKRVSRFDFERWFPALKDVAPPDDDEKMKRVRDLGRGGTTSDASRGANQSKTDDDGLDLCVLYIPKCENYPRGERIVFTKTHLAEEVDNPRYPTEQEPQEGEPNPNEEPPWPVFPFVHLHRDQSPFGLSPVHDAIQPNKAINGLCSKAVQHAAKLANAKVKVPNDLAEEWDDTQGQVFKVPRRNFDHNTLGYINPPAMPAEYVNLWREQRDVLYEFMGLNQPAVGGTDTGDQSGYAIRLRQQTADNDLEKVRKRHNDMWAAVYRYDLLLWRRHTASKRKIEIVGENRRSALRALDATAILPSTNVYCVNDSSIPREPTERMIWLQQFMGTGVMQLPPAQRQEMFQLMRLHDFRAFEERKQGDRMRADRQIRRIMDGKDPGQVSELDDHLIQMDVLREFGLSEEFETKVEQELMAGSQAGMLVPGQTPSSPTWTRLIGLYQGHKKALMAQTQAQAPAAPPGGPGGGMGVPPGAQPQGEPKAPTVPAAQAA